jgi:hypothetical protein
MKFRFRPAVPREQISESVSPLAVKLHHYYHVYADGAWREPVEEHLLALKMSGLQAQPGFSLKVGFVGSEVNIAAACECLSRGSVRWSEVARAAKGWEQVTLAVLADESRTSDGLVFYAHTKGASAPSRFNTAWRQRMTYHTVTCWREATQSLETHDAYGCHWMKLNGSWLFGGNFWWTRMCHLRLLPLPGEHSRWAAEGWIGLLPRYIPGFSACDPAGPFPGKIG